jgi:hypothetical protein
MSEWGDDQRWGQSDRLPPQHHLGFDRALDDAVQRVTRDDQWPVGEERVFTVGLKVKVVKTNPGWIGGYAVILEP